MTKDRLLRHAASRASQNPFFLAGDLEAFRTHRNMQERDLARFLGCRSEVLPKLGLCRRPDPDSATFRSDVDRVAKAFGTQADRLVHLIRESDVLDAIGRVPTAADRVSAEGLLMAARDMDSEEPNESGAPSNPSDIPAEEDS